jgi:hypothetical protein
MFGLSAQKLRGRSETDDPGTPGKPANAEISSVASARRSSLDSARSRLRSRSLEENLLAALLAGALATVIGAWALQLWKASLRVPFQVGVGDELFNLVSIKDVLTHGWDLTNPNLGAPFGQELYDFPAFSGDTLYLLMVKALGILSRSPAVVTNLFFMLNFPLIAASAFWVLRRLGVSLGSAVVCATLYAVLPWRLQSYEIHIFLSAYFIVPICCYVIIAVFGGSELFARNRRLGGLRAYLTARSAAVFMLFVVIGSADNYFALFTVGLMIPAAILTFLATRRLRPLVCALAAGLIILAAVAFNGLPTIIYHLQHGNDTIATSRTPEESDRWGLALANLVLPVEGSRIPGLASLAHSYYSTVLTPAPGESDWTNLGLVGTLGLIWLTVAVGRRCLGARRDDIVERRGVYAAFGAGIAFLIGTVG